MTKRRVELKMRTDEVVNHEVNTNVDGLEFTHRSRGLGKGAQKVQDDLVQEFAGV